MSHTRDAPSLRRAAIPPSGMACPVVCSPPLPQIDDLPQTVRWVSEAALVDDGPGVDLTIANSLHDAVEGQNLQVLQFGAKQTDQQGGRRHLSGDGNSTRGQLACRYLHAGDDHWAASSTQSPTRVQQGVIITKMTERVEGDLYHVQTLVRCHAIERLDVFEHLRK